MNYVEYITRGGERWDVLAEMFYGDPMLMTVVMLFNDGVPWLEELPGGLVIKIPVIDEEKQNQVVRAPWD